MPSDCRGLRACTRHTDTQTETPLFALPTTQLPAAWVARIGDQLRVSRRTKKCSTQTTGNLTRTAYRDRKRAVERRTRDGRKIGKGGEKERG